MPTPFQEKYTDRQREALATAAEDRKIKPYRRVAELAEAGELEPGLPAFPVPGGASTVADLVRKLRKRRAGEHTSELAKQPPRDAIEILRRRLVNVCDEMLTDIERQPAGKRDPDRVRQAARAIREAAAIPGPTDPTPPRPGSSGPRVDGVKQPSSEGATRTGPAGALLQAHRAQGAADTAINAPNGDTAPAPTDTAPGHGDTRDVAHDNDAGDGAQHDSDDSTPGGWARAEAARLAGRA